MTSPLSVLKATINRPHPTWLSVFAWARYFEASTIPNSRSRAMRNLRDEMAKLSAETLLAA